MKEYLVRLRSMAVVEAVVKIEARDAFSAQKLAILDSHMTNDKTDWKVNLVDGSKTESVEVLG